MVLLSVGSSKSCDYPYRRIEADHYPVDTTKEKVRLPHDRVISKGGQRQALEAEWY